MQLYLPREFLRRQIVVYLDQHIQMFPRTIILSAVWSSEEDSASASNDPQTSSIMTMEASESNSAEVGSGAIGPTVAVGRGELWGAVEVSTSA